MLHRTPTRLTRSTTVAAVTLVACACACACAGTMLDAARLDGRAGSPDASATRRAVPAARRLALIIEPEDGIEPVLELIGAARHSVEMTMYELADGRVERALAAAATSGVRVRVLLDCHGWAGAENRKAFSYLRALRVAVRCAPARFVLTHQKSIEIDRRAALIMTFNLTPRYYDIDRDFAVLDDRPRAVAAIEAVFEADWSDRASEAPTSQTDRPSRSIAEAARGSELVLSPGAEPQLLGLIADARSSLDVEGEEMDDQAISQALCAAARRQVQVQITMTSQAAYRGALERLVGCGAEVHLYPAAAPLYIHAKAIVVDGRLAFVGSQNFSAQSLCCNRELGIVFAAAPLVRALQARLASDFAGAHSIARR